MKRAVLFFLFLCLLIFSHAQDTLRMMQYNLMYYTNTSGISDCNQTTNNLNTKDAALREIFHYVLPDVFCVNEIGSNVSYADRILDNDINVNGIDYYRHGPVTSYSGGYIANAIFYDSKKLTLYKSEYVTTAYRDFNGYTMYYNSTDLEHGDTVFVTFWIGHLKAGSYANNEDERYVQVQRLMNRISRGNPGNIIVSGDFNTYSSDEKAYQHLTDYDNSLFRFYDPIDQPGHWNNNASFAKIHTQSTHSGQDDCFSSGGLDDRFDHILVSPYIYYGTSGLQVLPETYHALGQDGRHFNQSITASFNDLIPKNIAQALYNESDHLPVIVDFIIDATVGVQEHMADMFVNVVNPIRNNLEIKLQTEKDDRYLFEVFSIDGKRIMTCSETLGQGIHQVNLPFDFAKGFYFLKITDSKSQSIVKKIVK